MKKLIKKIIILLFCLICVSVAVTWVHIGQPQMQEEQACAFCKPTILEAQTFYSDQYVRGLCTHKPMEPWHCLIVTQRHLKQLDEVTNEEFLAIGQLIKKINDAIQKINGSSSYLILQKNGPEVGQTVPHVHVHYIPKKITSNKLSVMGLMLDFVIAPFQSAIDKEQMAEHVATMRAHIEKV